MMDNAKLTQIKERADRLHVEGLGKPIDDVWHVCKDAKDLLAEVERLRDALEQTQAELIPIRGFSQRHDSDITSICGKIRSVLNGDDYE